MSSPDAYQKQHSAVTESYLSGQSPPALCNNGGGKVTLLRRLGWYPIATLVLGTAIILGCVAFICFLWIGQDSNALWHRIVLAGWTSRSITITALLLRLAVASQAAVCTSMLAALILHSFQAPLPSAAALSLIRFSNTGPRSLLTHLPKPTRPGSLFFGIIVLLLTVTALLLQFTSTALLSDIGTGMISVTQSIPSLAYGINSSALIVNQVESTGYLGTKPASYPAFAEYSEIASSSDGVRDTGVSLRAFLPIDSEASRDSLRNYSGMATLIDTRAVCMQPIVTEVKVSAILGDPTISGLVGTDMTAPRFNRTSTTNSYTPFNCTFAVQGVWSNFYATSHEWPLAMCKLNINDSGIISEMDPLTLPPAVAFNPGDAYLLINSTGSFSDWGSINNAGGSIPIMDGIANGEWVDLHTPVPELSLSLTLCYTNNVVQDASIDVSRLSNNNSEAALGWDNNTSTFDTLAIRRQLGATTPVLPPSDRHVFSLAAKSSWERPAALNYTPTGWTSVRQPTTPDLILVYAKAGLSDPATPIMLCGYCQPGGKITTARAHSAVFSDILQDTGDAAVAVQALITTLFGLSYYEHAFQFDVAGPALLVSDVGVLKPTGRRFFIAVLVVAAAHLVLVMLMTVLFVFGGSGSLLGSAWAAVAQLRGVEVESWLAGAGGVRDGEVKRAMENEGVDSVLVGVGDGRGVLEIRRR